MNFLFWFCYVVTSILALIFLYFFLVGLSDGSVGEKNRMLWILILSVFTGLLVGTIWLKNHDKKVLAVGLLSLPTILALFGMVYLLIFIIGKPDMR